jgi:hypothetical protein
MIKNVIAGAALCSVIPAFAAANLVTAGSSVDFTGSGLAGWVALPGDTIDVRNGLAGNAQEGVDFVELDSTRNSSMLTSFQTVPGQTYTLSFWYSGRPASSANTLHPSGIVPASSNGLSVSIGGKTFDLKSPTDTSADNQWRLYTTTFTGTGQSMSLMFGATGKEDGFGSSLDNVSVTAAAAAVPEPATMAMMGAGLLGLLGLGRRRSRAR